MRNGWLTSQIIQKQQSNVFNQSNESFPWKQTTNLQLVPFNIEEQ